MIMSTIASTSLINGRNSLLRLSVIAGLITGFADAVIYHWFFTSVLGGVPLITFYQFIASGALGESAFAGSIATALLGVLFHYLISIVIAGVFILSADRIPLLRRYVIPGSLLYGFGVFIVMNMIVMPLSATPPIPAPTTVQLIVGILDHLLIFGLLLAILVRRNANTNQ
jgi:uncharacterized membrane protein YagU involved in acid resistance